MRERMPMVTNHEMGKDQAAAESHLRRLNTLESDVNKFSVEIERLRKAVEVMLAAKHFDSTNVSTVLFLSILTARLSGCCEIETNSF